MFYISRLTSFLTLIFMLVLVSMPIFAADEAGKSASADINNIGFMQNPPKELKEKFPMCDAFLKVEWINKEKKVGYSNYEAIMKNKDGQFIGKKMVWALVDLDVAGIDYDVYQYKRQGKLQELFGHVRNGKVKIGIPMMIEDTDVHMALYSGKSLNYGANRPLLSDHKQTVCITYPDQQRAFIVEGKNVKQTFSKVQIDDVENRIKIDTGVLIPRKRMEELWLLDINFDGKSDFLYGDTLIYSEVEKMQVWKKMIEYPNTKFTFPSDSNACNFKIGEIYSSPLSTDGKNYYLGICNLTTMTSKNTKE